MKNLVYFISGLVIVSIIALVCLAAFGNVKDLSTETYKAFLQLLVIGIAGHVVSILLTKANQERQEYLEKNEFRNSVLSRINTAFVEIKKLRRLSRATSFKKEIEGTTRYYLSIDDYHSYMQLINETQLQLEVLEKDITSNAKLFTHKAEITSNIDKMEEYLNQIVDEYEHTTIQVESDSQGKLLTINYPKLHDLVGNYRGSEFRTEFVHAYYSSLEKIRDDLVHIAT